MIARLAQLHPLAVKLAGMALVAVVLLGTSLAFGLFDSGYDINGPYNQLYPVASPTEETP